MTFLPRYFAHNLCVLLALWLMNACGHTALLDWDVETWSPNGALSQTFTDVDGSGVDITITMRGNTNRFIVDPGTGNQAPDVSQFQTGGLVPVENSLFLGVQYADNNERVVVTVTFSETVKDVDFTIFDIDELGGDFQDRVVVRGRLDGGSQFGPETATGSVANTVGLNANRARVTGDTLSANTSGDANASFDFGSTELDTVRIIYRNLDPALGDQWIALHDISFFSAVPEADVAWALVPLVLGALVLEIRRRKSASTVQ